MGSSLSGTEQKANFARQFGLDLASLGTLVSMVAVMVAMTVVSTAAAYAGTAEGSGVRESPPTENSSKVSTLTYEFGAEDTLGAVALRFDVAVSTLRKMNQLEGEPRAGDVLEIPIKAGQEKPKPKRVRRRVHIIRRGDTFEGIARRYGVTIKQLKKWNRRLKPKRLQIGDRVVLGLARVPESGSVSYGKAFGGRLYNGIPLTTCDGLQVRNEARSYGTESSIRLLRAAAADIKARWPDAPDLHVGDLSLKHGGRMRPHRSHQSGRDADISYYHRGNVQLSGFRDMTPDTFDAVKNWHFFKMLIDTEKVEYIFVEYRLQEILYAYATSIGYTPEDLEPILQYPHGRGAANGIIRHARGHDDHFHIRFHCPKGDSHCD